MTNHAGQYAAQVPKDDPFFISWEEFQEQLREKEFTTLEMQRTRWRKCRTNLGPKTIPHSALRTPQFLFTSLDAFRPLGPQAPEPQIAEAQRREFFSQLHRWSRQGYAVHVFCNNDGESKRFGEIWNDYGFGRDTGLTVHLGALSRGFICEDAKLVVVTDAEIFGRYKVQRPRRLKSPHAQAARSALDIDFTEFEEGDYVVHLQHGIGRYLGLKVLADGRGTKEC